MERIAETEVFGPAATVVKFSGGEDEAVRVANNSRYGISGVGREHGEDGFREYLQAKTIASPA